jgi:hypothetical protein
MGLLDWLKLANLASAVVKAWRETVAFFTSLQTKQAGRNEVILEVKETSDDAVKKAAAADAAVRDSIAAGGLRDDDGYRRD